MRKFNRSLGCGMWLAWLFLGVLAGEWLLLWLVLRVVPEEQLLPAVLVVVIVTVVGGWAAVYLRLHRRVM